jgi:ABC-type transport system involved in cytochrome bd biosynthesis fused ATPase/permease subunit
LPPALCFCLQDADVYILDDPLSAVDVHVGRHIFDRFIQGAAAGTTRLLVTNQLQYTQYADRVVVLEDGNMVAQVRGTASQPQGGWPGRAELRGGLAGQS